MAHLMRQIQDYVNQTFDSVVRTRRLRRLSHTVLQLIDESEHIIQPAGNDRAHHPSGPIPTSSSSAPPEVPFSDWRRGWQPQDGRIDGAPSTKLSSRTINCPHHQEHSQTAATGSLTCRLCALADAALAAEPPTPTPRRHAVSAGRTPSHGQSSQTSQLFRSIVHPSIPPTAPTAPTSVIPPHRIPAVTPNNPLIESGLRAPRLVHIPPYTSHPTLYPGPSIVRRSEPTSATAYQVALLPTTTPPITPRRQSGPSSTLTETSRRLVDLGGTPSSTPWAPSTHRRMLSSPIPFKNPFKTPLSASGPSSNTNSKRKREACPSADTDGESSSSAESLRHPAPKRRRPIR